MATAATLSATRWIINSRRQSTRSALRSGELSTSPINLAVTPRTPLRGTQSNPLKFVDPIGSSAGAINGGIAVSTGEGSSHREQAWRALKAQLELPAAPAG